MTDKNSHIATDSQFPTGWTETTLEEVIDYVVDNRGKTPPLVENGYELLEVNAVCDNAREPDYSKVSKFVDEDTFKKGFRKGTIKKGDILIPTVGTIGNASYSKQERGAIAQNLIALRTNTENNSLFLYYFLTDPNTKKTLLNLDIGGVQPSIKVPHLLGMQVGFPPLPEQKAIASVLSAFDDKIELLREQNKTLEEMGQVIFQEWFGAPKSPEGDLPEGWRVGKLGEVGQIVCGKTPSKENQEYFGGEIPFIKIPDMHGEVFIVKTEDSLTEIGANTQKNKFIPKNSICVSCIATVGLVSITSKDSQTNQQINSIVPNDEKYLEYLYFVFTNMKNDLMAIGSGGSATLNINTSTFSNIEVIIPNEEILENFHNTTTPIFTKILDNLYQIQSLARSRDELLPRLMRGEVRVEF